LWGYTNDYLLNAESIKINGLKEDIMEQRLSDSGLRMFWATVCYFKKTKKSEIFFNFIKYIRDNYAYYSKLYDIGKVFRNDYAFSIAYHMTSTKNYLPFKQLNSYAPDQILNIKPNNFTLITERYNKPLIVNTLGRNIHLMNKFDLDQHLDTIIKVYA
jgi:hypothetical protein